MISRLLLMGGGSSFPSAPTGNGVLTPGSISTITSDGKYNAFASVTRMAGGSLLIAYMKADTPGGDNTGRIMGKISSNDGASWGSEFEIANDTLGCLNPGLVTLTSGRVVLSFNLYDFPDTPVDAVRVVYSDDNASTWSSFYTVNSSFTGWCASGTSRLIQLPDDTIILPVYGLNSGQTFASSQAFFSTDDGATFGGQVTIANGHTDGRHYYEPSPWLLANGTILCQMRTSDLTGTMYQNASTDDGATWSAPTSEFGGYSPSNVFQRYNHTVVATVRGNAAGKVQAFASIDEAATWDDQGILDAGSYTISNYACGIDKLNGSMLVVYAVETATNVSAIKQIVVTEGVA